MYSVRFMPRENGVHNIHVKFNGVHIPGSPFRLKVGKGDADPAAVHATGSGLGDVKTGNAIVPTTVFTDLILLARNSSNVYTSLMFVLFNFFFVSIPKIQNFCTKFLEKRFLFYYKIEVKINK